MTDKAYVEKLENALAQILKPMKGVPFSVVVRALADQNIIQIDPQSPDDRDLIATLEKAIHVCAAELKKHPIERPRPNEVGNDVEPFVTAILKVALRRVHSIFGVWSRFGGMVKVARASSSMGQSGKTTKEVSVPT